MRIRPERGNIPFGLLALAALALADSALAQPPRSPVSLTMEGAISTALSRNSQLRSSQFAVEKARWDRKHARSLFLPTLNVSTRMTRIDDRSFAERDFRRYLPPELAEKIPQTVFQTSYFTSLDVSVPIFSAALVNGLAVAGASEEMAVRVEQSARDQLVFQVISRYLDVLKSREVLNLQRDYLELTRLNYEKAERLHRADRYSRVEALRWKVEDQQQQSAVVSSESTLRTAATALARLLDMDDGERIEVEGQIPERLLAESDRLAQLADEEILRLARMEDGALIQANAALAAARSGEEVSRLAYRQTLTAYMPSLSLSYSHAWRENRSLVLDDYSPKTVMVFLSMPVFSGLQNYTSARAAHYEYRQHQEQLADQVQSTRFLLAEVANRLVNLKTQRELAGVTVEFSEQNYRIVERQKEQGRVSNIDFIDAKLNLQNAKLNQVTAHYDFIAATVELYYLLGRLEPMVK